jgi:hypothetical protein
MKPRTGILRCISLIYYAFDFSLLGQDEKLNPYFLHSGLDENPRGNLRNGQTKIRR